MMNLDEAIKHCEEVAEEKEKFENFVCGYCAPGYEDGYFKDTCRLPSNIPEGCSWGECTESNCPLFSNCLECASEHRQLAGLLKELKKWREIPDKLVPKYRDGIEDEYNRGANEMLEEVIDDIRKYMEEINADEADN